MWLEKYSQIRQLHQDVYDFRGNYIPLGVSQKDLFSINSFDLYSDHRKMFEHEMKKAQAVKRIDSDMIPCVVLRYDPILIPSMFGGKVINVGDRPWVAPWLCIDDVKNLKAPTMDAGIMPTVERAIEYFIRNTQDDIIICTPPEPSPLEIAVAMIGSDLYYDVCDQPESVAYLLEMITHTFIEVENHLKSLIHEPLKEKITYWGTYVPGIRMACDSIVNLSPEMIRRYMYPAFREISDHFGKILVHYCPAPANKHFHVLEPLFQCPDVLGIDTTGGIQYFDDANNIFRMKKHVTYIADCPFAKEKNAVSEDGFDPLDIMKLNIISWQEIGDWLKSDFMRLSLDNKRGTILRSQVNDIEEGKELYALWQEFFRN